MALIDEPQEEQFDAVEAAKRLGISSKTLMRHVKAGTIRYINVASPSASRPRYRFTPYILKQFQNKQQKREAPPCHSTKAPTGKSNFSSKVVSFADLRKPGTRNKLRP
ncbi:hypothetical protein C8J31_101805 [Rhizobium sp. PP-CC-2G-626]|nr:hypothetical protein C8J31_101805 [Rhizobium sp. PP-CC-2G-626]